MKRYDLLLALNGIISAASDADAAEIMLERSEALRKRIKGETEMAVVEGWMHEGEFVGDFKVSDIAEVFTVWPELPEHASKAHKPVTLYIYARKP